MSITRRSFVAGLASVGFPTIVQAQTQSAIASASSNIPPNKRPDPIELGGDIEVTDFRVIPKTVPAHYLIEIQSNRTDPIDSPTVGIIWYKKPVEASYSWARPFDPVLYPGESTFAIGILPKGSIDANDTSWLICEGTLGAGTRVELVSDWSWELTHSQSVVSKDQLRVAIEITNSGQVPFSGGELRAIARDGDNRICGGLPLTNMYNLQPGATVPRAMNLVRGWNSLCNPFLLCQNVDELRTSVKVQPRYDPNPPSCPAVMPWNR